MAVIVNQNSVNPLLFLADRLNKQQDQAQFQERLSFAKMQSKAQELSEAKKLEQRKYETELQQLNTMRAEKAAAIKQLRDLGLGMETREGQSIVANTQARINDEYKSINDRMTYLGNQSNTLAGEIAQIGKVSDLFVNYKTQAGQYYELGRKRVGGDTIQRGIMNPQEVEETLDIWQKNAKGDPEFNRSLAKMALLSVAGEKEKFMVGAELDQAKVALGYAQIAAKNAANEPDWKIRPYVDQILQKTDYLNSQKNERVAEIMDDLGLGEKLSKVEAGSKNVVQAKNDLAEIITKFVLEGGWDPEDELPEQYQDLIAAWDKAGHFEKKELQNRFVNMLKGDRKVVEDLDFRMNPTRAGAEEIGYTQSLLDLYELYSAAEEYDPALLGGDISGAANASSQKVTKRKIEGTADLVEVDRPTGGSVYEIEGAEEKRMKFLNEQARLKAGKKPEPTAADVMKNIFEPFKFDWARGYFK